MGERMILLLIVAYGAAGTLCIYDNMYYASAFFYLFMVIWVFTLCYIRRVDERIERFISEKRENYD